MFQAFATLLFTLAGLLAMGSIVLLLRDDWDNICHALGMGGSAASATPLPLQVRAMSARRAVMMRVEVPAQRRVAA